MKNKKYLIGIDIGTSASKITVIDLDGNVAYSDSCSYKIDYLPGGRVEQSPDKWYKSITSLIKEFLSRIKPKDSDILSLGISSQSPTIVPVDKKGGLLHTAILYLDKRSVDICNSYSGTDKQERIYKINGSTLKPSYTGPQIQWIIKNRPDIYKSTYKFLTANGYINFKLTGKYSHDLTQTGMTGIFDRIKGDWSEELLGYFKIDREKLPSIYRPDDIVGETGAGFKQDSGFPTGIPVVAGTLDVASTMLGSGCINPGSCFVEMGSVINLTVLIDRLFYDRNLQTYPSAATGINIVAGSVDGAGNTIKWFLDEIYGSENPGDKKNDSEILDILEKKISATKIGSDNLIFLPFMSGMRTPRSDLETRGAFLGLKVSHKKIDIYRSILEGCSYGLKYNLEFMKAKDLKIGNVIASGGASKNRLWMQMISDILGVKIKRSQYDSGASIGSAMLAGIGSGVFKSLSEAIETVCKYDLDFIPTEQRTEIYSRYYKHYKKFMGDLIVDLDKLERTQMRAKKNKYKAALRRSPGNMECKTIMLKELNVEKVLVRIIHAGICGSDIARVKDTDNKWNKVVLGHEAVGIIEDLSVRISSDYSLKKGDKVALIPLIPCHKCYFCKIGKFSSCPDYSFIGSRIDGAFSEYIFVDPTNLIKLPQDDNFEKYTLLEPLTVALHALYKTDIKFGRSAVIFGAGTIGLLLFQVLKNLAHYEVAMVDIDRWKLALASDLGSQYNIDPIRQDLIKYIKNNIDNSGADVVFEISGANQARAESIRISKPGGEIILVGTSPEKIIFDGPVFELITRKEIKLTGTWMSYSSPFPGKEWKTSIDILKKDLIDTNKLITHRYKLDDIKSAFNMIFKNDSNYCKVLINT